MSGLAAHFASHVRTGAGVNGVPGTVEGILGFQPGTVEGILGLYSGMSPDGLGVVGSGVLGGGMHGHSASTADSCNRSQVRISKLKSPKASFMKHSAAQLALHTGPQCLTTSASSHNFAFFFATHSSRVNTVPILHAPGGGLVVCGTDGRIVSIREVGSVLVDGLGVVGTEGSVLPLGVPGIVGGGTLGGLGVVSSLHVSVTLGFPSELHFTVTLPV